VIILYFLVINGFAHLAFVGARMTTTLHALELGAPATAAGVLMALFALLPMLLSLSAGRLIDRTGPARPLALGLAALVLAVVLPGVAPSLPMLFVSSTLVGTSFMYCHIAMNNVFGSLGGPGERAVYFSWLALGFSVSNSVGPLVAGFAIDALGHARAFLVMGAFPAAALALLLLRRRPLPRPERGPQQKTGGVLDLLRIRDLRHTLIVSSLLAMGWDLFNFLIPLYGASLGLSAVTIGAILSSFAVATFAVRLFMPILVRRLQPWALIFSALLVSGAAYLLFPFVDRVPLLIALSFFLGLGLGSAQPMIMALLYERSPPGRQGEVVGVRTTLMNGSHTLIPLASGALAALVGTTAPAFWILAALLLGGAWFARRKVE
jgi:MFS family permease